MVNKKVQKIIASFMVIGSLAGTIATSTTEAASRDYEHKHNQKIEYRNDDHKDWHKKVDLKAQKKYMKKVRQIMNERNIHVPPGHWAYGKRVPQRVMIQYRESHDHYYDNDNDNDLLLGLILGAVIAEAVDND